VNNIWFGKCGDEDTEDHLIPLTPRKKFGIDNSCRAPTSIVDSGLFEQKALTSRQENHLSLGL